MGWGRGQGGEGRGGVEYTCNHTRVGRGGGGAGWAEEGVGQGGCGGVLLRAGYWVAITV